MIHPVPSSYNPSKFFLPLRLHCCVAGAFLNVLVHPVDVYILGQPTIAEQKAAMIRSNLSMHRGGRTISHCAPGSMISMLIARHSITQTSYHSYDFAIFLV